MQYLSINIGSEDFSGQAINEIICLAYTIYRNESKNVHVSWLDSS